jgi:hypothetical protein
MAKERIENDNYPTEQSLADAICVSLQGLLPVSPDVVVEPSAGDGAFVQAARRAWPNTYIEAIELRPECREPLIKAGASNVQIARWEDWSEPTSPDVNLLILGNPPYEFGPQHVELCFQRMAGWKSAYLCFLLRASFLSTQKRYERFYKPGAATCMPRFVKHVVERPSFRADGGTDQVEYTAVVWKYGHTGSYEGSWLSWR